MRALVDWPMAEWCSGCDEARFEWRKENCCACGPGGGMDRDMAIDRLVYRACKRAPISDRSRTLIRFSAMPGGTLIPLRAAS